MVVNFSMIPVDKGISLSSYVAQVVRIVEESGLEYHLHSMGTLVEGEWEEVFGLIKKCHEQMRSQSHRVITNIQIDDRQGAANQMDGKKRSVEKVLGHTVH